MTVQKSIVRNLFVAVTVFWLVPSFAIQHGHKATYTGERIKGMPRTRDMYRYRSIRAHFLWLGKLR